MARLKLASLLAIAALGFSSSASWAEGEWSGFYIGGVAGYGWGNSEHCDASPGPGFAPCSPGFPNFNIEGGTGGVTVGYNMQNGYWVYGVEADYSFGEIDGSSGNTVLFGCGGLCATEIESYGTLRGRVGRAFNNILPYVTAGVAISQLTANIGNPVIIGGTDTAISFVGGGGVEMMFADNWSGKIEGLWISSPGDFAYDTISACGAPGCFTSDNSFATIRIGINRHFKVD